MAMLVLLATIGAGSATAAQAAHRTKVGRFAEFSIGGGRENSLSVFAQGQRVAVSLSHGAGVYGASTEYATHGSVSRTAVHANFGKLGMISVSFRPAAPAARRPLSAVCGGDLEAFRTGVFTGTIRFRSEDGALEFHSERARGAIVELKSIECEKEGAGVKTPAATQARHEVVLSVSDCHGTSLLVSVPPESSPAADEPGTSILVSSHERRGRIAIFRVVYAFASESPLRFPEDLSSATLAPPPPFAGSGEFSRDPASGDGLWSGSLTVSFVGKEVPLTGHGMEATLERASVPQGPLGQLVIFATRCPRR
jgi:hypothetical protein